MMIKINISIILCDQLLNILILSKMKHASLPHTIPTQLSVFKQIVKEANLFSKQSQQILKKNIEKKYVQHLTLLQYHKIREQRFIASHKKVMEETNQALEKKKQFILVRQTQAASNKDNSLNERTKRIQNELSHWETIVQKNKDHYKHLLQESDSKIKDWNDKLSEKSERKSTILNKISSNVREKISRKQERSASSRLLIQKQHSLNPQKQSQNHYLHRNESFNKISRVSTESAYNKKKVLDQSALQKSLVKTVEKQKRINEARYVKHYINDRKRKLHQQKAQALKNLREDHMKSMRSALEERNLILDQKFKRKNVKARNKDKSLPHISGNQAIHNSSLSVHQLEDKINFKHKMSIADIEKYEASSIPSYDRRIMEKLRNVSLIMRNRGLQ